MALTVVKYRKSATGNTHPSTLIQRSKVNNPVIKIGNSSGLIIKRASVNPAQKRISSVSQESAPAFKSPKFSLQTIASAGTPNTSLQWQPTTITSSKSTLKKPQAKNNELEKIASISGDYTNQYRGSVIGSLPPNTIIQTGSSGSGSSSTNTTRGVTISPATGPVGTMQVRRPTIYIKREAPTRTMQQMTIDLIEKNPKLHIGLDAKRLILLKNVILPSTGVSTVDCLLTLRKLRQNEDCAVLAELFEMPEDEVLKTIARSVASLAHFMRALIRWPDSKKYYDRYKEMPYEFRDSLAHVQSLIEIVDTEMRLEPDHPECQSYKFILSITPIGIITHVSDAFLGKYDDLTIFAAAKFKDVIPKYLTLMADPGKAVRRKHLRNKLKKSDSTGSNATDSNTDSAEESAEELENDLDKAPLSNYAGQRLAGELAADQTLSVINNQLHSSKVKNFKIPTMRVTEPVCRQKIRATIDRLREYRILGDCSIREPLMFQYLNEVIIVVAAFSNLMLE